MKKKAKGRLQQELQQKLTSLLDNALSYIVLSRGRTHLAIHRAYSCLYTHC